MHIHAYICMYTIIDRQSKCGRSILLSLSFSFSFILSTSTYVLDVGLRVGEQQNTVCGTCFFPKYHQIGWMAEWSKALVSGTSLRARVRIPLQSFLPRFQSAFLSSLNLNTCHILFVTTNQRSLHLKNKHEAFFMIIQCDFNEKKR